MATQAHVRGRPTRDASPDDLSLPDVGTHPSVLSRPTTFYRLLHGLGEPLVERGTYVRQRQVMRKSGPGPPNPDVYRLALPERKRRASRSCRRPSGHMQLCWGRPAFNRCADGPTCVLSQLGLRFVVETHWGRGRWRIGVVQSCVVREVGRPEANRGSAKSRHPIRCPRRGWSLHYPRFTSV